MTAFAGGAAQAAMPGGMVLKAVAYNHINYQVADYAKVRDFYVNLFGMKDVWDDGKQCSLECRRSAKRHLSSPAHEAARPAPPATGSAQMGQGNVDHFAFSIENFELEPVRTELSKRGLDPKPDGAYAWSIKDPSGTTIQICATKGVFPGAAAPTAKESDGTKNLGSIPGPDGKGFKAYGLSHLVYNVPDVDQSRDFYMNLLGMKLVYYKPGNVFGIDEKGGPICFLKFGENYFYLRKSQHPDKRSVCRAFYPGGREFRSGGRQSGTGAARLQTASGQQIRLVHSGSRGNESRGRRKRHAGTYRRRLRRRKMQDVPEGRTNKTNAAQANS